MTFPTEWKVINYSMVPLLIILSYYIAFKTPLYPIIPNIWESQKMHVPVTTNQSSVLLKALVSSVTQKMSIS